MKIARECIHCMARQAVEIAEEATTCEATQQDIIRKSLNELAKMNFNETSPEVAYRMHQHAKEATGIKDPYYDLKQDYNKIAQQIADRIRGEKWMENADKPFDLACRLAIAGNIIDFSAGLDLDFADVLKSVEGSLSQDIFGTGVEKLEKAVVGADRILYIVDNAGEIIFDRFLIEHLPMDKVTLAVKGGPIVNDATLEDAVAAGLTDMVTVIDNGHDAQGTVLHQCSRAFLDVYDQADLIISKGQANFETLSDQRDKNIHFMLRAKCISVANAIGCEKMDYVLTDLSQ